MLVKYAVVHIIRYDSIKVNCLMCRRPSEGASERATIECNAAPRRAAASVLIISYIEVQ